MDPAGNVYVAGYAADPSLSTSLAHSIVRRSAGGSWATVDDYQARTVYGDRAFTADSSGNLYTAGAAPQATWIVRSQPAAPTNLTAAPDATSPSTQIDLTWTNTAGADETGFAIYRSTDGISFSPLAANLPASATAYSDTTVSAGTTYYYQAVALLNSDGASNPSNTASATTQAALTAALSASAAVFSSTQITSPTDPTSILQRRKHRRL